MSFLSSLGDSSGIALKNDLNIEESHTGQITKGGYNGYQFNPFRFHRLHRTDYCAKYLGRTNYRRKLKKQKAHLVWSRMV